MADLTCDGVNDVDITAAGSSTNIGGVIFTDAVNVGSGTGGYNTFLAISDNDGIEQGFNSDDTPPDRHDQQRHRPGEGAHRPAVVPRRRDGQRTTILPGPGRFERSE